MADVTKAELQGQLAEMTKRATQAEARVEKLAKDLGAAKDRAAEEAKGRQDAEAALDTAREELKSLNASLKAYKGSATRAKATVEVLRKQISPQARPIGTMKPAKSEEQAAERAAALAAALSADTSELVFSDGRREIRELAPVIVTGDAWRDVPSRGQGDAGKVLNVELDLEPGDCARASMDLKGFGLLNEMGEQVGWCPLPDAIAIGRNMHFRLPHNSVRF